MTLDYKNFGDDFNEKKEPIFNRLLNSNLFKTSLFLTASLLSFNYGVQYSKNNYNNQSNQETIVEQNQPKLDINDIILNSNSNTNDLFKSDKDLETILHKEGMVKEKLDFLLRAGYIKEFGYNHYLENPNPKVFDLYKNDKISEFALIAYLRSNPVKELLVKVEDIFQIPEYKSIIGAESDFIASSKSSANAIGLAQLTKGEGGGIEGLFHKRKRDKEILKSVLDIEKLEDLVLKDYFEDSVNINLESLGLNRKNLKSYGVSEIEVREVMIPRYLVMNKIGFDEFTRESIVNNIEHNVLAGAAHYFSGKYELSILSAKKSGDRIFYVDTSREKLKENPHLGAFLYDIERFAQGAYNAGVGAFKNKYLKLARNKIYDPFKIAPNETREHKKRINDYKAAFEELKRANILVFNKDKSKPKYLVKN